MARGSLHLPWSKATLNISFSRFSIKEMGMQRIVVSLDPNISTESNGSFGARAGDEGGCTLILRSEDDSLGARLLGKGDFTLLLWRVGGSW
jgi:hypothetical protein